MALSLDSMFCACSILSDNSPMSLAKSRSINVTVDCLCDLGDMVNPNLSFYPMRAPLNAQSRSMINKNGASLSPCVTPEVYLGFRVLIHNFYGM